MFKCMRSIQRLKGLSLHYPASSINCSMNLAKYDRDYCCQHISSRNVTTNSAGQYIKELFNDGKWKLKNAVRKVGVLDFSRNKLCRNGYYIYEDVADNVDYNYFFRKFNMPDTFYSWFLIMELHLWIILVRLMAEAEEGRFVRNMVIEAMWEDIRQKTGLLGVENTATARAQIKILSEEFQAALVGYDEGLLGNDIVLAGALWRRFFTKNCNDPELVEVLVKYIRKHIKSFDLLTKEDVLLSKKFHWLPIEEESKI